MYIFYIRNSVYMKFSISYIFLLSICIIFNRYEEAEKDCTQAILLDGSYSKAFARRGTARTFLGKLSEAKQGKTIFITTGTHSLCWQSQVIVADIFVAFPWFEDTELREVHFLSQFRFASLEKFSFHSGPGYLLIAV